MTPRDARSRESEEAVAGALRRAVRRVMTMKGLARAAREDRIVQCLTPALEQLGRFYRMADGTPLFFRHHDRRLYEVSTRPESEFGRLVTWLTDCSATTPLMKQALERLQARVAQTAEQVEVHGLAYNSPDTEVVAINDFGGGMWYRRRGGTWESRPNGYDGILFWTPDSLVETWTPEFGSGRDEDYFDWFLEQPNFGDDVLTAQDQRLVLRVLLLSFFFPGLNRTRPIQVHLGQGRHRQHDTGKTTAGKAIGLLLMGRKFQPTPAPEGSEKGQEAVQLALMHQPFVLLDNVDTDIRWLNDFLCTYATGARPSKRRLYTDTAQVHVEYRGRLAITSRRATFTRVDTATRTIPFRFKPILPEVRKTEGELLDPVLERRGCIWAGVLSAVARVQDALPRLTPPAPTLRLADFERFGWLVAAVDGQGQAWAVAMRRLRVAQDGFALEGEPLVPALRELLRGGDVVDQPMSQVYEQVCRNAAALGLADSLPRDAAAFSRRLNELREPLESVLDASISTRIRQGTTHVTIVQARPDARGDRGGRSPALSVAGKELIEKNLHPSVTSVTPWASTPWQTDQAGAARGPSGAVRSPDAGRAPAPEQGSLAAAAVTEPGGPGQAMPPPGIARPSLETPTVSGQGASPTRRARLLSLRQAAEYLGVSSSTIRRWVKSGKLPYIRLPGRRLFRVDRTDLDRLIESGRVGLVPRRTAGAGHHAVPPVQPTERGALTRPCTDNHPEEDQER